MSKRGMQNGSLILVVDDVADGRAVIHDVLDKAGFRVAEAGDGEQALVQAHELRPSLIIMDLSLPQVDGWEVTRRLKQDDRTRDIPVLALSAHALDIHAQRATEAGCAMFCAKPCPPDQLLEAVRTLLSADAVD